MDNCIFCQIANGQIPAKLVYEDEWLAAFPDIKPQAAVHILVVPKKHVSSLADVNAEHEMMLGRLLCVANRIAIEQGSAEGCRVIINNGKIGQQEVPHLHMHVLGGNKPLGRMLPDQLSPI